MSTECCKFFDPATGQCGYPSRNHLTFEQAQAQGAQITRLTSQRADEFQGLEVISCIPASSANPLLKNFRQLAAAAQSRETCDTYALG